jgi:hypothetical protein
MTASAVSNCAAYNGRVVAFCVLNKSTTASGKIANNGWRIELHCSKVDDVNVGFELFGEHTAI